MRLILRICIAFISIAVSEVGSSKTICPHIRLDNDAWVSMYVERSDLVFLGKVASVTIVQNPNPECSKPALKGTMQDLLRQVVCESNEQSVTINVSSIWKGAHESTLTVRNYAIPFHHGFYLTVGQTYLFFAYEDEEGQLRISTACRATLNEAEATDRINALNRIVGENQPIKRTIE